MKKYILLAAKYEYTKMKKERKKKTWFSSDAASHVMPRNEGPGHTIAHGSFFHQGILSLLLAVIRSEAHWLRLGSRELEYPDKELKASVVKELEPPGPKP
jgi:hypothetical protein